MKSWAGGGQLSLARPPPATHFRFKAPQATGLSDTR
jgi:hypothetical protein